MLPDVVVPMHVVAQADLRLPEGAEPVPVHEFRLRYAVCGLYDGVVVGAPLRGQRAPGPEGLQHLVNLPVREFAAAVRVVDVDLVQGKLHRGEWSGQGFLDNYLSIFRRHLALSRKAPYIRSWNATAACCSRARCIWTPPASPRPWIRIFCHLSALA